MPRYSKLLVCNHARKLVQNISAVTRGTRGEGDLISQIRRASLSVAANIAEGAERGSDRDFVRFLKIADGSNAETQALTRIAGDAGIFNVRQVDEIVSQTNEIGYMLRALIGGAANEAQCCDQRRHSVEQDSATKWKIATSTLSDP